MKKTLKLFNHSGKICKHCHCGRKEKIETENMKTTELKIVYEKYDVSEDVFSDGATMPEGTEIEVVKRMPQNKKGETPTLIKIKGTNKEYWLTDKPEIFRNMDDSTKMFQ